MRFDAFLAHARAWLPGRTTVDARERVRAVAGAGLGLLVAALLSHWLAGLLHASVWLIAPLVLVLLYLGRAMTLKGRAI